MYSVNQFTEQNYQIYELKNSDQNSWVRVVPERGGIITEFAVNGEDVLFLNKETLFDPEKNIRGGIPILFPISGQLDHQEYEWAGQVYKMKNHGVARNQSWQVTATNQNDSEASITLKLESNSETKESFPFDFEIIFTYTLKGNQLEINQQYINHSGTEMPIYAGFHPYFKTAHKNLSYETDAHTYLDYNDMEVKNLNGNIDLSDKKESVTLLDIVKRAVSFELPELGKKIVLKFGDEFKYVVLWTEKDQGFVCVEPWMAKTNELNRQDELVMIQPGETLKTSLSISV